MRFDEFFSLLHFDEKIDDFFFYFRMILRQNWGGAALWLFAASLILSVHSDVLGKSFFLMRLKFKSDH